MHRSRRAWTTATSWSPARCLQHAESARGLGPELGIAPERTYGDYAEMAQARSGARPDGIEAVAIVTPNHCTAPIARAFLEGGHPRHLRQADDHDRSPTRSAGALVARDRRVFALTHNYTGYPMVRQARAWWRTARSAAIRVVQAEYAQDWLTEPLEATGQKQAEWRTDPGALGPGRLRSATSARMPSTSPASSPASSSRGRGRPSHLRRRAAGSTTMSRPAALRGRRARHAVGEPGRARQREQPPRCASTATRPASTGRRRTRTSSHRRRWASRPALVSRGGPGAGPAAAHATRLPFGRPEGFYEAFANLYADAAELIWARIEEREPDPLAGPLPTVRDGVAGVRFIEAVIRSGRKNGAWTRLQA